MDVLPFLFGYLTEREGSEVKSVDYTMSGWFFCIMCYPPFNSAFSNFLPTVVPEYMQPVPGAEHLHMVLNGIAFLLLVGYASASVSLGFKASNLTRRGVVDTGLYAYVIFI